MSLLVIFAIVLIWRVLLFGWAAIVQYNFPFTPQFPYSDSHLLLSLLPRWIWSWANFDGVHYINIARQGYMAQFTQAFFPGFPFLVRWTSLAMQDQFFITTALLISFISFTLALWILSKLLKIDYPQKTIIKTLLFILIFPTSFYFAAFYTEAFFIMLVIAAFYFARTKRWYLAGLFGLLASITRVTGIFLLPALLFEWYQNMPKSLNIKIKSKIAKIFQIILYTLRSPILYLVPLGLVGYMFFLQKEFGDALYFWHAQSEFGRSTGIILPPQVVWRYIKILATTPFTTPQFRVAGIELFSFLLSAATLILAHRQKIRPSYLIFSWLVIITPTFTGTLSSLPRYMLLAFPIFIVFGNIKNKYFTWFWFLLFAACLPFLASFFLRGLWVA